MIQLIYDLLLSTEGLQIGRFEVTFTNVLLIGLMVLVILWMIELHSVKTEAQGEGNYLLDVANNRIAGLEDALDEKEKEIKKLETALDETASSLINAISDNKKQLALNQNQQEVIKGLLKARKHREAVNEG